MPASGVDFLGRGGDEARKYTALATVALTVGSETYESRAECLEYRKKIVKFAYDEWKRKERDDARGIRQAWRTDNGEISMVFGGEPSSSVDVSYRDGRALRFEFYCLPSSIDPRPRR